MNSFKVILIISFVAMLSSCASSSQKFSLSDVVNSDDKSVYIAPLSKNVRFREKTSEVFLRDFFIGPTYTSGIHSLPQASKDKQVIIGKINPSAKIYKEAQDHIIQSLSLDRRKQKNSAYKIFYGYQWYLNNHPVAVTTYQVVYEGTVGLTTLNTGGTNSSPVDLYRCDMATDYSYSYEDIYNEGNQKLKGELIRLTESCIDQIIKDFQENYDEDLQSSQLVAE